MKEVEIYVTSVKKEKVNPKDVISALLEKELPGSHWIKEEKGSYYETWEASAGCHSIDQEEKISKERYDYLSALILVLDHLKKKA